MKKAYGIALGIAGVATLVYNGAVFVDPDASAFGFWSAVATTVIWGWLFSTKFAHA